MIEIIADNAPWKSGIRNCSGEERLQYRSPNPSSKSHSSLLNLADQSWQTFILTCWSLCSFLSQTYSVCSKYRRLYSIPYTYNVCDTLVWWSRASIHEKKTQFKYVGKKLKSWNMEIKRFCPTALSNTYGLYLKYVHISGVGVNMWRDVKLKVGQWTVTTNLSLK